MSAGGGGPTLLFQAYCALTWALAPLAWTTVRRKLSHANVPVERQHERLGRATLPRPPGRLIWFHAASVGESLSVLSLITRMGERLDDAEFLITSGTPTSAALIAKRLPPRTRHQFAPLDAGGPVHRFYDHWRPQAGIFVESELWPRLIVEGGKRGLPLAVLNARLSQKSVKTWCKFPSTAHFILDQFGLFLTQNAQSADDLSAMGADVDRVRRGSNLKAMSAPLPVDEQAVKQIGAQSAERPIWVASSTHPGEERLVLAAHQSLLETHPDLLLLLVPRHPERGDEVARVIKERGLTMARRTGGDTIRPNIKVYLADTLGELGAWYTLCPLVFLGGSLKDIGGHNPFEPAQAGAAVITGPGYFNFAETYRAMLDAGAAIEVRTATELAKAVDHWLTDAAALDRARSAARVFAQTEQSALDGIVDQLCLALKLD